MNKWFKLILIVLLVGSVGHSQWKGFVAGSTPATVTASEALALAAFAEGLDDGIVVLDTLDVERINFTSAETGHSIYIDRDMAFSEIGDNYPSGIYIDLEQTDDVGSGAWAAQGGMYGLNSRIHIEDKSTGGYAVLGRAYIGSDETINDVYGIMGEIRLTGNATRGAATSSIAGLRSSISNLSTGTWDGQMFGLMLDFGANMNFGDESALIFGYSHADAYLDYGMHLSSLSTTQAMTSGVYIEAATGATVTNGIEFGGAGSFTNDILLSDGSKVDGATTNGATLATATGVTNVNYTGGLNRTVITFTAYDMVITDSGGSGGHGTLKLIDFPEGVIRVTSAIGDMSTSGGSGYGATSAVDMALGSATTLTNAETLGNANVDFVAKVDETLSGTAGVWDLIDTTPQDEDGHTGSTDVWLCVAVFDSDMTSTGTMTLDGTIVITWHNMGDY